MSSTVRRTRARKKRDYDLTENPDVGYSPNKKVLEVAEGLLRRIEDLLED